MTPGETVAETPRLLLRGWLPEDAAPFAAMNADPEVTRFVGGPMDAAASDALLGRIVAMWEASGFGRPAVVERATGELLGFTGLGPHPSMPGEIEIGWRLVRHCWGRGYATEAARAMRDLAFGAYGLPRLISVAHPDNAASLGVMRKIGMRHHADMPFGEILVTVYAMDAADPRP